jgi:hypothetical protein
MATSHEATVGNVAKFVVQGQYEKDNRKSEYQMYDKFVLPMLEDCHRKGMNRASIQVRGSDSDDVARSARTMSEWLASKGYNHETIQVQKKDGDILTTSIDVPSLHQQPTGFVHVTSIVHDDRQ